MTVSLRDAALRGKPLTQALIIDWHVHLGRWLLTYSPVVDEAMFAAMERVGVSKICVNGSFFPSAREGNNRVAEFARRFPERAVPFAFLNPYQNDLLDELKRCVEELGMRGLKVHSMIQGPHSRDAGLFDWSPVWEYCGRAGVPVLAHGIVHDEDIRRHPGTVFVIAHGIGVGLRMRGLRECANAYVDTAWTQTRASSLKEMVEIIGGERILWGSDAPLDDFAHRLGVVLDAGLSEEEQRKILGLNAARLLRLSL